MKASILIADDFQEVHYVVGEARLEGHPTGVLEVVEGAAAALGVPATRPPGLVEELHGDAEDLEARAVQQGGHHGAVHPAAHGGHDADPGFQARAVPQFPEGAVEQPAGHVSGPRS